MGSGGAYRSDVFRLDRDGPQPVGIGQQTCWPVFLRLARNIGRQAQVDVHLAALVNGGLTVKNQDGDDLRNDKFDTARSPGLTLRHRF